MIKRHFNFIWIELIVLLILLSGIVYYEFKPKNVKNVPKNDLVYVIHFERICQCNIKTIVNASNFYIKDNYYYLIINGKTKKIHKKNIIDYYYAN